MKEVKQCRPNDIIEAYTGNPAGRKEECAFLKRYSLVKVVKEQLATVS